MNVQKKVSILLLILVIIYPSNVYTKEIVKIEEIESYIKLQPEVSQEEQKMIKAQKEIDEKIEREYNNDVYNLDRPYIKLDPYNFNKLCALVMFETDSKAKLTVEVTGSIPIINTYSTYAKQHEIPIVGLYPNENNKIKIVAEYEDGKIEEKIIEIQTEKLPEDFPTIKVEKRPDNTTSELTYACGTGKAVKYFYWFDTFGEVRFLVQNDFNAESKFTSRGTILMNPRDLITRGKIEGYSNGLIEINYLGRIINYYKVPYEVHHEFFELPNENIVIATSSFGNYVEDGIVEIDRETGNIVNEWDFKEILDYEREGFLGIGKKAKDWLHINSIFYNELDNSLIISGRHQGVIKIDKDSNEIKWILSDPQNWSEEYQQYLLIAEADNFEYPYAQHSAIITKEGNLMLYDNGNNRSLQKDTAIKDEDNYSRAVEYQIDEEKNTIRQVWQYGKERGNELYTNYIGSVQELENNKVYICFGGIRQDDKQLSKIIEVSKDDLKVLSETAIENGHIYRAKKFDINGERAREKLIDSEIGQVKYDSNYYNKKLEDTINGNEGLKIYTYIDNTSDKDISYKGNSLNIECTIKNSNGIKIGELTQKVGFNKNIPAKGQLEVFFYVDTDILKNDIYILEISIGIGDKLQDKVISNTIKFKIQR